MKLFELVDTLSRSTARSSTSTANLYKNKAGLKKLGGGAYGDAYSIDSPHRQNEIIKISRDRKDEHDDPYEAYIEAVENYNKSGGSNPYFPRILSHRSYRNDREKMHGITRIEKLYPLESPKIASNTELMESLGEDMFYHKCESANDIFLNLYSALHGQLHIVKDEQLKEACELIINIVKSNIDNFFIDSNSGNFMWRITGNRPHLVITDPIGSFKY